MMDILSYIKWYYLFFIIYIAIGCKIAKINKDAFENDMEIEGVEDAFSPPSTNIGIMLFWLLDIIYLFTRKTR